MKTYHVRWVRYARTLLAAAWLAAADRNSITRAQHAIDTALTKNPKTAGRELSEGLWKIERSPLVAFYEIDDISDCITVNDLAHIP